jgi:hypothetical protein
MAMTTEPEKQQEWELSVEARCRRETVWQALQIPGAWQLMWGDCDVDMRLGGAFVDKTGEIMPNSRGEFVRVIPYRRFDLYWFMARAKTAVPEQFSRDNSVLLTFSVEELAPSVQQITVRARWAPDTYPPRGKWVGLARGKWEAFLKKLAATSKKMTAV